MPELARQPISAALELSLHRAQVHGSLDHLRVVEQTPVFPINGL